MDSNGDRLIELFSNRGRSEPSAIWKREKKFFQIIRNFQRAPLKNTLKVFQVLRGFLHYPTHTARYTHGYLYEATALWGNEHCEKNKVCWRKKLTEFNYYTHCITLLHGDARPMRMITAALVVSIKKTFFFKSKRWTAFQFSCWLPLVNRTPQSVASVFGF